MNQATVSPGDGRQDAPMTEKRNQFNNLLKNFEIDTENWTCGSVSRSVIYFFFSCTHSSKNLEFQLSRISVFRVDLV
jgi:hypothetical protein